MRTAALLYNSRSGGRRKQRQSDLQKIQRILADAKIDVSLVLTQSNADAAEQARKAVADGCDTVFACGGDGTVHDVLQGLAGRRVALGVIPMGTANALAHDLGLPLDPAKAVRALIHGKQKRIALGQVRAQGLDGSSLTRYFTVAVGVGVDAHLFYKLHAGLKQRMGMAAYYAKAWHLWFTHRMERFVVSCGDERSQLRRDDVTEMLAVRVRNFGGVLKELAPGASLDRNDLRVVTCRTSSRLAYLSYVTRGFLRASWNVRGVEIAYSEKILCDYAVLENSAKSNRVYVEADGEFVGTLPAEITIVPDALTLLVPNQRRT